MRRREFLQWTGLISGTVATSSADLLSTRDPISKSPNSAYGLLECPDARLLAALGRSRNGILRCTVNDQTHCCDAGFRWGTDDAINDLYFGLHGGLFTGGADQHSVFRNELRKFAKYVKTSPNHPAVPWSVSADGLHPKFNRDPGCDLDRSAEFVLNVVRTYEVTGDREFAAGLYPQCREVVEYLGARDLDGDLLPEGRTQDFPGPIGPGGEAGSSITYIGDTVANAWKDFGAALFYYEALCRLALLEKILGRNEDAVNRLALAAQVRTAAQKLLWNEKTNGFLAWVERNGTPHDDWITGNNLHAVACGLASREQSNRILHKLAQHRGEIEELIPCRVRLGLFEQRLCSNRPNYYWNGGIWTLVSAPDMMARARMGDLAGAMHVSQLLSTHPKVTDVGFYEAYDGVTGEPNNCRGLLMNNGGFIWGFFEGVMGVEFEGDELRFRASVPKEILPARARLRYRDSDLEITWASGQKSAAQLNGKAWAPTEGGYFRLTSALEPNRTHHIEIVMEESSSGRPPA